MGNDRIVALASSIHAMPGAYAVLLGSGTSNSAGVMTTWDIGTDLARRLALVETSEVPTDPRVWYRERHGEDVDYSQLLERLAPAPGDRQALLDPYFEPDDDEREQGLKAPTRAHRALADLVAAGYIKIIITTNFDRLIERALQDAGVEPLVIASADEARDAPPLHSCRCVVIKVHGDRHSPNLKNTLAELDAYEPELNEFLQQILRDYGLIVCGWSADWDPALRNLIVQNPSKVFATFWTHRGEPSAAAQGVIKGRLAIPIAIEDADSLFDSIAEKVFALRDLTAAAPANTDIAVAQLKRHLTDPTQRIRVHDLMHDEVERVIAETSGERLPVANVSFVLNDYVARIAAIEESARTLIALLANLGYFADDDRHDDLAVRLIERLATEKVEDSGIVPLLGLQRYRALLGLYALGLGALAARRPRPLARALAEIQIADGADRTTPIGCDLAPAHVLATDLLKGTEEFGQRRTAASDLLHARLRAPLAALIPDDDVYDGLFDDLEYLHGVSVIHFAESWAPIGRFVWRRRYAGRGKRDAVLVRHRADLLAAGLFDRSPGALDAAHSNYEEVVQRSPLGFGL